MSGATTKTADLSRLRRDFPALDQKIHGKPLVYLDNAATSQKPRRVIEALHQYHLKENSNIHRGVHTLSMEATRAYEEARLKVRRWINAAAVEEIVFVRGTTEAINLVAHAFGRARVGPGDEVLVTHLEHHSNIVPWQILCEERRAKLVVAPIDDAGEVVVEEFERRLTPRTKLAAVAHVSNALGTIVPVKTLIETAHRKGVPVLVDGAQAVPHTKVDVQDLDADFYAFSGHKMYGPTGIGVLYGKRAHLEAMPPYQAGGDMILSVTFERTIYNHLPHKFEAGTPNIAGTIGLGAAIDYLEETGLDAIEAWEAGLLSAAVAGLSRLDGVRVLGPDPATGRRAGVVSFLVEGVHPHDVGTILDHEGIAIRTGHHCAQPLMERFGVEATCRASLALYNTYEEIDALTRALGRVRAVFQ
jgi:cysteine desulfurase/selenocysteine lyase